VTLRAINSCNKIVTQYMSMMFTVVYYQISQESTPYSDPFESPLMGKMVSGLPAEVSLYMEKCHTK
jgi:hypothetical protein